MAVEIKQNLSLEERKNNLLERLRKYGIEQKINSLPYLDDKSVNFQTPQAAGKRTLILYAVAYIAHHPEERPFVIQWMRQEGLWEEVSAEERDFFKGINDAREERLRLSWRTEAAGILAWTLGLLPDKPEAHDICEVEQLSEILPAIGSSTKSFFNRLQYRPKTEIFDENIFNELATAYFREVNLKGKEDFSGLEAGAIFERHRALNWLRKFSGIEQWDRTDTSVC